MIHLPATAGTGKLVVLDSLISAILDPTTTKRCIFKHLDTHRPVTTSEPPLFEKTPQLEEPPARRCFDVAEVEHQGPTDAPDINYGDRFAANPSLCLQNAGIHSKGASGWMYEKAFHKFLKENLIIIRTAPIQCDICFEREDFSARTLVPALCCGEIFLHQDCRLASFKKSWCYFRDDPLCHNCRKRWHPYESKRELALWDVLGVDVFTTEKALRMRATFDYQSGKLPPVPTEEAWVGEAEKRTFLKPVDRNARRDIKTSQKSISRTLAPFVPNAPLPRKPGHPWAPHEKQPNDNTVTTYTPRVTYSADGWLAEPVSNIPQIITPLEPEPVKSNSVQKRIRDWLYKWEPRRNIGPPVPTDPELESYFALIVKYHGGKMGSRTLVEGADDIHLAQILFCIFGFINETSPVDRGPEDEFYIRIPVGTPQA